MQYSAGCASNAVHCKCALLTFYAVDFSISLCIDVGTYTHTQLHIISSGETIGIMLQAALCLEHYDISCEVIDLRTLLPWDVAAVGKHARLLNDAFAGIHCCTQIRHKSHSEAYYGLHTLCIKC